MPTDTAPSQAGGFLRDPPRARGFIVFGQDIVGKICCQCSYVIWAPENGARTQTGCIMDPGRPGPGGKSDRGRSWYFVHFLPQRRARMNDRSPLYVAGIIHLMLMLLEFWFVSPFFYPLLQLFNCTPKVAQQCVLPVRAGLVSKGFSPSVVVRYNNLATVRRYGHENRS